MNNFFYTQNFNFSRDVTPVYSETWEELEIISNIEQLYMLENKLFQICIFLDV